MLREHKRRVVRYIEATIPEDALDMGTSVMVMQTVCQTPGCVPLETSVIIVFPKDGKEHIEGLSESCGGTFKTKILLPMSEVTKDDVLDALPPAFEGMEYHACFLYKMLHFHACISWSRPYFSFAIIFHTMNS